MLSARRGACPRSESLLARRVRLRRRRRPRMPPPLPSRSARRDARVHCRRRACGDAAFCGAIRRGGSSALSSSRSRRVDPALPLAVGVARSPLAWRRAAGRAAAQSAASSAARRAVLVLASARAVKACSTACPPSYHLTRDGSQASHRARRDRVLMRSARVSHVGVKGATCDLSELDLRSQRRRVAFGGDS